MVPPVVRIVAATVLFAVAHSALASRSAKQLAARTVGERAAQVAYRPAYVGLALASSAALAIYGARLPRTEVYRMRGAGGLAFRAGQLLAIAQLVAGIRSVGLARLLGLDTWRAWRTGRPLPAAPVAQGPERGPDSQRLRYAGPFLRSRHPLNFWAVPLFWCTPRMTTRRLAFNLAATAYLALGSLHEEKRLRAAYGAQYERYAASGPAFFVPRLRLAPPAERLAPTPR
jgi:protein-S-isoprenylcysteine O-methyltransferase Ste14